MSQVTLVHPFLRIPQQVIHTYSSLVVADMGVVKVDSSDKITLETVWRQGFKLTPDGKRLDSTIDLFDYAQETAKSSEE